MVHKCVSYCPASGKNLKCNEVCPMPRYSGVPVCYGIFLSFGAANFILFRGACPASRRSSEEAKKKRKNKKGKK